MRQRRKRCQFTIGKKTRLPGVNRIWWKIPRRVSIGRTSSAGSGNVTAAKLIVTPAAHLDIAQAYDWYEDRRPGLSEDFLGAVDACVQRIRRNPELMPIAYETYRRGILRRFPYTVIYEAVSDVIAIYAVFHSSRDPEKWRQRLP